MESYEEALRHLREADRLMESVDETLIRAELSLPIDSLMRRLEGLSSYRMQRSH